MGPFDRPGWYAEAWVRAHEVALPWTVARRYVAGVFAVATRSAQVPPR